MTTSEGSKPTNFTDGISVEISLTPDTVVTHSYRQTGEDDWAETPITLMEAVVEAVATKITGDVAKEAKQHFGGGYYSDYSGLIRTKIEPEIDARVQAIVTDVMAKQLTPTDAFGNTKGAPTTLQEVITARVEKWLITSQGDSYSRDKGSPLEKALAKLIDREMTTALNKVIADAQRKALATVAATAEAELVKGLRTALAEAAKAR